MRDRGASGSGIKTTALQKDNADRYVVRRIVSTLVEPPYPVYPLCCAAGLCNWLLHSGKTIYGLHDMHLHNTTNYTFNSLHKYTCP